MNYFVFNICMVSVVSEGMTYLVRMYVPIVPNKLCVQMRKKAVALEKSCIYSMVYVLLRQKTTAYQNSTTV
jgi:hypothetical protein